MIKKVLAIVIAALIVTMPLQAQANQARISIRSADLKFSGTTATCSVNIEAENVNSTVIATIQLWQGGSCIATWYATGLGNLHSSNDCPVTSGLQYTMTVSATIDGTAISIPSVTRTCP